MTHSSILVLNAFFSKCVRLTPKAPRLDKGLHDSLTCRLFFRLCFNVVLFISFHLFYVLSILLSEAIIGAIVIAVA